MSSRRPTGLGPLPVVPASDGDVLWRAVQESVPAVVEADAEPDEDADRNQLKNYWLLGKGLAKWATSPHPWTALYRHLKKYMPNEMAKRVTSQWYFEHFGHWPGQKRKDKNAVDGTQLTDGRVEVREAATCGTTVATPGRMLVRLIRAGISANGNAYPAPVLEQAARDRAWPAGSPCFVDHATDAEEDARPSGSIRNLAGVLATDATWDDASQSLVAEVRLFHPWRETLTDMAEHIGMSIRAWVTGDHGQHEGRDAFVVRRIEAGRSVDFVTAPAAGGGIISVLEAVGNTIPVDEARNAGHWFESRIHAGFTELADRMFGDGYLTRDERITLSSAIGDGLAAFAGRIESDAPHLYQRDPWQEPEPADPTPAAETAGPTPPATAETVATEDVTGGAPPPDPNNPTEEEPVSGTQTGSPPAQAGTATVPDGGTPPTNPDPAVPVNDPAPPPPPGPVEPAQESATARALTAVTAQLAAMQEQFAALAARDAERAAEARRIRNEQTAREAVTAAVNAPDVPAQWRTQIAPRVTATVLAHVPTGESGDVDVTGLNAAVTAAVEAEVGYYRAAQAQALEEAGIGVPAGLGASQEAVQDDGLDAELKALFESSLGLPTNVAAIAVKGRN